MLRIASEPGGKPLKPTQAAVHGCLRRRQLAPFRELTQGERRMRDTQLRDLDKLSWKPVERPCSVHLAYRAKLSVRAAACAHEAGMVGVGQPVGVRPSCPHDSRLPQRERSLVGAHQRKHAAAVSTLLV